MKTGLIFLNRICIVGLIFFIACSKSDSSNNPPPPPVAVPVTLKSILIDNVPFTNPIYNIGGRPVIKMQFSQPIMESSVPAAVTITGVGTVSLLSSFQNNDSVLIVQPSDSLQSLTRFTFAISTALKSKTGGSFIDNYKSIFFTHLDSADKFPQISDSALLTLVQKQTFKYFWDFGHPVSGLSRERTSSNDIVTTGGSGFGIMSMLVAVQRNFISRAQALSRIDTIVNFLTNKVTRYHGAFPHWINGATGATVPFSQQDNGGDIVETAYMLQGLLCARQFFNSSTDAKEIGLRTAINSLYDGVEWNWYRQNSQNALTWNWSPDYNWAINFHVSGWNEALITYVLAASSNVSANTIPKIVYDNGWAGNGSEKNGQSFYSIKLPLGPDFGGPLFFAHYSFLGINPHGLSDAYANYWEQDTAHATINYLYCVNNPQHNYGYSSLCWGLTASDIAGGYTASSPTNDVGVIAPTAAISSLPYTPVQSINAIRFFYYKLGDKIWGQYGFTDAFNLSSLWIDADCLAIDQGPEIVMIENYRSGLLWNLFMSCPEIKTGMKNLGFSGPNL
jgi:hypothetical protein